jgi:L-alanine-DL-glutamate epimerase-like enolase superfamily enzyme/pimeloyl-ACP methyl ester carboxylesterase
MLKLKGNLMNEQTIRIEARPLNLPLKTTFRHAGATRDEGESIWVKAERNGISGIGEGCPRTYAAGDDLESSLLWIQTNFSNGKCPIHTLEDLKIWILNHRNQIDRYPSAWCALELALLDLFSKEKKCSVESLLGLEGYVRFGRYTAVLGDSGKSEFIFLADQYFIRGFTDFKIKLSGDLKKDQTRLDILENLRQQHSVSDLRIRLDANNLWTGRTEEAIRYIKSFRSNIFAIEEPVGSHDAVNISKISKTVGLPIILDESLCTLNDLELYKDLPGDFIANIKISRVGGLIRSLELVNELKKFNWPIIIGCHVGETSMLTRAALIPAFDAGKNLIAQEGAFGDYLLKRDPVNPVLKFGRYGILNLDQPYYMKTIQGLKVIPTDKWNIGFGMQCRMPFVPDDGQPDIHVLEMPDKYKIHYRIWGNQKGDDVLLILHGGMSHSGWQAPLAKELLAISPDISIVASDRRGCGLNANRGDLGSVQLVIEDVIRQINFLKHSFSRVHLAGWCQGCQYASIAAAKLDKQIASLILLTPGFFWNERFRSIISVTERVVLDMMSEFKIKPDRDHAYVPIPMEATDFSLLDEWLDFIESDTLKTTRVTAKSVKIMDEIQEISWNSILKTSIPVLSILAEHDRIVDNSKVQQFLNPILSNGSKSRLIKFNSGHAIQFEIPKKIAGEIYSFIREISN